jgi:hypothetical protein
VNLAGTTVDLRVAGAALRDSSGSEYYREQDKLLLGQKNHVIEGTHVFLAVMQQLTMPKKSTKAAWFVHDSMITEPKI